MCRREPSKRALLNSIVRSVKNLNRKVDTLMSETQDKLDALATRLSEVSDDFTDAANGLRSDIDALKAAIEAGQNADFSAVDAKVDALVAQAEALKSLDAENPEAPVEPPAEEQ